MTFEMALALFIIVLVIGVQFVIFRAKWGDFFHLIYKTILDIVKEINDTDLQQANVEQKKKVRQPFTWELVKYKYTMPFLFLCIFPVQYFFIQTVFSKAEQNTNFTGIMLCGFIIILLMILVVNMYGHYEKKLRRKFWLELMVAIAVEFALAFDLYLLLTGYFFESVRGAKSLAYTILFFPCYFHEYNKTQRNWKALQDLKHTTPNTDDSEAKPRGEDEHANSH